MKAHLIELKRELQGMSAMVFKILFYTNLSWNFLIHNWNFIGAGPVRQVGQGKKTPG